mgnify:CR=1 FL=1
MSGTMVKCNTNLKWIEFEYEKCPDFCFCYSMIDHNKRDCSLKGTHNDKNV